MELKMYKPLQRLDYCVFKHKEAMYLKAKFIVLLHGEESIDIPDGVYIDNDNYFEKTFYVTGEASGEPYEFKAEYKIKFIDKVKTELVGNDLITRLREEVKFRLDDEIFTVRTRIKKQVDMTNVHLMDPGDIFLCDPPPDPLTGDDGSEEGTVTNTTGTGEDEDIEVEG